MKQLLIAVLLVLMALPLRAVPPVSPADSMREELKKSLADTSRVMHLLDLSFLYMCRGSGKDSDLDSAMLLSRQAEVICRSLGYQKGLGSSYLMASRILRKKGEVTQGKAYAGRAMDIFVKYGYLALAGSVYSELTRYYSNAARDVSSKILLNEQALSYFVRAGDRKKEADVLKEQGDLHQLQGNYQKALSQLQRALKLYRALKHPEVQGVYDLLGFVSTKTGDYKAGLAYGLQAEKTARLLGDTSLQMCTIYNRLGLTYQALGLNGQADDCFKKSLSIAQKYSHVSSIVYLSGNISSLLINSGKTREALLFLQRIAGKYSPEDFESRIILAGRFMDVYQSLRQFDRAQPFCDQVLELAGKDGAGSPGMATTYHSVIQFFLASRQYGHARRYLHINQEICQQQGSAGALASNHLQWFRLDSAQGSYPSGIAHYQRYVAIRDSLLTENKNRQIAQLEVQYQTEKKDQELKLKEKNIQLLTEKGKVQYHKLEQARMIRNGTIAGALMLVLLLGLGYSRYRFKQKINRLLEAKQLEINQKNHTLEQVLGEKEGLLEEKEWMLREIHHRVRNNLQIVISLLNSQAGYLSDNAALSTIKESQHRVQAMALIHQKLYQSEKVARVEMASYINDLVVYLRDSYSQPQSIRYNLKVEPLELDVSLAVPLGLIINEALTNALKYAFPGDNSGTVSLSLHPASETTYELTIADDGAGLPPGYDPVRSRSLGMTLMHGLSEQLGGVLHISGPPGVVIRLVFQDEQLGATFSGADHSYRWHRTFTTHPRDEATDCTYWKL